MAYNFLTVSTFRLKAYLNSVFNTSSGHNHDGTNSKKITSTQSQLVQVETLAAGVDIANRVLAIPTIDWTVTAIKIISQGTPVGIDASNTCVINIKNGTDVIATITYGTVAFPANGSASVLTIVDAYKTIAAGTSLKLDVTNGTTANSPMFTIQITHTKLNV